MARATTKTGYGSGWHFQTKRHSNARRTGKAGGRYVRTESGLTYLRGKVDYSKENLFSTPKSLQPDYKFKDIESKKLISIKANNPDEAIQKMNTKEKKVVNYTYLGKTEGFNIKQKWVSTDVWRGYDQPIYAIAGVNDTGEWSDSPSRGSETIPQLKTLQKELKKQGIQTKKITSRTSNIFARNHFLIAKPSQYEKAKKITQEFIKNKNPPDLYEA